MKANGKADVAKVNVKNKAGLTPFHIACREDHCVIVKLLLDTHQDLLKECDDDKATPLHYACQNDCIDTVVLLMKKSSNLYEFLTPKTSDGVTPIHVAAQYGCVKVMKEFLKKVREVVDVRDTYNQTPLHYATEYGKTAMMALLLNRYIIIICRGHIQILTKYPHLQDITTYIASSLFAVVLVRRLRMYISTLLC